MPSLSSLALDFLTRSDCLLAYSGLRFPSSTYFMATSTSCGSFCAKTLQLYAFRRGAPIPLLFQKKVIEGAEIPVSWRTVVPPASTTSRLTDAPSMTAREVHRHPVQKPRHALAFRLERRPTHLRTISVPPNGSADPWRNLKCSESLPEPPVAPETLQQMSSWHGHPMQSEADIVLLRGCSPSPWSGCRAAAILRLNRRRGRRDSSCVAGSLRSGGAGHRG